MVTDQNHYYSSSSAGEKRHRLPINDTESAVTLHSPPLIAKLGDDLLVEILIRSFPNPKSACRCKPVSKLWRSLISTPHFTRRLISTLSAAAVDNDDGLLPPHRDDYLIISDSPPKSVLSFLPAGLPRNVRHRIRVFDCFKDLLLCGFADKIDGQHGSYSFLICNPFTKQWIALPLAPRKPLPSEVVCIYAWRAKWGDSPAVDVFCSESGEWTEGARVLSRDLGLITGRGMRANVVSWNGELFWSCHRNAAPASLVGLNHFLHDGDEVSLTSIELPRVVLLGNPRVALVWDISVSQGNLHVILLDASTAIYGGGLRETVHVWRLEEDRRSWRKLFEVVLKRAMGWSSVRCSALKLHPEKSEIAFLETGSCFNMPKIGVYSCDLRTGEVEFRAKVKLSPSRWSVFQPRIDWFPTQIPRLQGNYDGSFECLVKSNQGTTRSQ